MRSEEQLDFLLEFFNLRFASPGNDVVIESPISILNSDPDFPKLGDLLVGRTGNDGFLDVDPTADNPSQGEIDILVGGFDEPVEEVDGISEEQLDLLLEFFNFRFASPGNDFVLGSPVSILNSNPDFPKLGDLLVGRTGNDGFLGVDPTADNPGQGEIDILIGGFDETIELTDGVGTSVNPDRDRFLLGDASSVYYSDLGAEDYALISDFDSTEDTIVLQGTADDYVLTEIGNKELLQVLPDLLLEQEMEATLQDLGGTKATAILRVDSTIENKETPISLDDPAYDLIGIVAGDLNLNLKRRYFEFVDTPPSSDIVLPQIEQLGTPGIDFAFGVAADSSGNIYQVGGTSGDLAGANAGANDVWIAKFDDNGNQLWIEQLGTSRPETAFSVVVDSNNNVFVSGVAVGDFGGTNAGGNDAWIAKFDNEGNQLWIEQLGTSERDNSFTGSLAVDSADNVIQGGYSLGDLGGPNAGEGPDAWVAKFDNEGKELWRRQFGTPEFDELFGVATDSDDNIFLTGWTVGDLGGTNAGLYDAWVAKYDSDGNQLWVEQFGTSDFDFATGVATDSKGNVYSTGYTLGNLEDGETTNAGLYDIWVAKYDSDGNQLWIEQFGGRDSDAPFGIAIDDNDDILLGGYTDGSLAGPGANAGGDDAWAAKLDSDGNLLDITQFGTAEDERVRGILVGSDNNVLLTGYTDGSLGNDATQGNADAWLAQLSATDLALLG